MQGDKENDKLHGQINLLYGYFLLKCSLCKAVIKHFLWCQSIEWAQQIVEYHKISEFSDENIREIVIIDMHNTKYARP